MSNKPIVHIVDADSVERDKLVRLFRSKQIEVAGYSSVQEFLSAYDPLRPGCLILDLDAPEMSGLELQETLTQRGDTLPIIVVSGHGDVPLAVNAMKRGAMDFIEKPFREQDLLDRVLEAIAKDAKIRNTTKKRSATFSRLSQLTSREREVMDRLLAGDTTEQISVRLGLSAKTVYTHRSHILLKLGADSIAALTRIAFLPGPPPGPTAPGSTHTDPAKNSEASARFGQ